MSTRSGLPKLGNTVTTIGRALPPSTLAVLAFGLPLQQSLANVGAPACTAYIAPSLLLAAATNPGGYVRFDFHVPPAPALQGIALSAQWLAFEGGVDALGIVLSDVADVSSAASDARIESQPGARSASASSPLKSVEPACQCASAVLPSPRAVAIREFATGCSVPRSRVRTRSEQRAGFEAATRCSSGAASLDGEAGAEGSAPESRAALSWRTGETGAVGSGVELGQSPANKSPSAARRTDACTARLADGAMRAADSSDEAAGRG